MTYVVSVSAAGAVCWLLWGFPSFLLSLPLAVQFTLIMALLAPSFCWYLDIQVHRDEVKGNYPLAYEDLFAEAMMAVFLFLGRFSVDCWPGDWRLLWLQPCGYGIQFVRVHIRAQDIQAYNRVIGSLSDNGMSFQFIFRLMLYRMDCMYSPIMEYVIASWSCMYIMDLRTLYFVYIAHPYGVLGPCLMAPVWQFSLPRHVTWLLDQDFLPRTARHGLDKRLWTDLVPLCYIKVLAYNRFLCIVLVYMIVPVDKQVTFMAIWLDGYSPVILLNQLIYQ